MKFLLYRYRCGDCGVWFEHHEIAPSAYGEFLLRNDINNSERYLNGICDSTYEEVDEILRSETRIKALNDLDRAEILQLVFGIACDPDSNGARFDMERKPRCSHCGSRNIDYWEATEPPRYIDLEIPQVTHIKWDGLTRDEKFRAVSDELDRLKIF